MLGERESKGQGRVDVQYEERKRKINIYEENDNIYGQGLSFIFHILIMPRPSNYLEFIFISTAILNFLMALLLILLPLLLLPSSPHLKQLHQCWDNNIAHPPLISESAASKTKKFEFSLHESTGDIFEAKRNGSNSIFNGDFSTVRVYGVNKTISVYEGLMMRISIPASNILQQSEQSFLEIQILHKIFYGKYQYEYIGVSHVFKASKDPSHQDTGLLRSLQSLQTGSKFPISNFHPFKKGQNVDKIFAYKLSGCKNKILWLVRHNVIQIGQQQYEELREIYGRKEVEAVDVSEQVKVYVARLRNYLQKYVAESGQEEVMEQL